MNIKFYIIFLSIIISLSTSAQITIDPNVKFRYNKEYLKLSSDNKLIAKKMDKGGAYLGGIVITVFLADDTLNRQDIINDNHSVIILDDDGKEEKFKNFDHKEYPLMMIAGESKSDTLLIRTSSWIMSDETITYRINKNHVVCTYNEYHKGDSVLMGKDSKDKTERLTIPVKVHKFILSDDKFTPNKTIYGYAEIETDEFCIENQAFKNNFLKQKLRLKYYFKLPLKNAFNRKNFE